MFENEGVEGVFHEHRIDHSSKFGDLCRRGSIELIDVRTPAEFREVHLRGEEHST